MSLRSEVKDWAIDTVVNVAFWHPVLRTTEAVFFDRSLEELINIQEGNFLYAFTLGGLYNRFVDLGRYTLNRPYYDEARYDVQREKHTPVRDHLTDWVSTSLFWNAAFAPWLHFKTGLSWGEIGEQAIGYTAVYFVASLPYGKFLNWSRRKLGSTRVVQERVPEPS